MSDDELRLEIDRLKLDEEWANQPALFYLWAKKAADAQLAHDDAKSRLDVIKAELAKACRDDPDSFDVGKVTDKAVDAAVITSAKYQKAVKQCNTARHDLAIAQAAVTALEHRKRALTMEVELYIKEYYAEPHARPLTEEGEEYERHMVRSRGRRRKQREQEDVEDD